MQSGILFTMVLSASYPVEHVTPAVTVVPGPINGVRVMRNNKTLCVYGDPRPHAAAADLVLFTHHLRDVVWAGREPVGRGALSVVPQAEAEAFRDVASWWEEFQKRRLRDTTCQRTRVLFKPLRVDRTVRGGDSVRWQDLHFKVIDTPGYTRGAVSYVVTVNGKVIAFTGDCIWGEGKLFDLYSLQDGIPEAGVGP